MPKVGDKIRITANRTGHQYIIGSDYKVFRIEEAGITAYNEAGAGGAYLRHDEYEVVYDIFSIKSLEDKVKEITAILEKAKYILNYLEENQMEECSLNELNADLMLHYLKTNQVKELAKILNEINSNFTIDKLQHH